MSLPKKSKNLNPKFPIGGCNYASSHLLVTLMKVTQCECGILLWLSSPKCEQDVGGIITQRVEAPADRVAILSNNNKKKKVQELSSFQSWEKKSANFNGTRHTLIGLKHHEGDRKQAI